MYLFEIRMYFLFEREEEVKKREDEVKKREEEANKKILQYGNVLVTNRELEILKGPWFLNDIILEFYFLHISNVFLQSHESFLDDILLVSPALSFFLQQDFGDDSHIKDFAESNKVASKQVIMFTVNNNSDAGKNDGGSHWSLLVYYRKSNAFVHYDSLGTNGYVAKMLFRAVKKHVTATPPQSRKKKKKMMKMKKQKMRQNGEEFEEDMDMSWNGDALHQSSRYLPEHMQHDRLLEEKKVRWYRKDGRSGFKDDPWNSISRSRCYQYNEEDDVSFKVEECMPKQKNYYDCGLYVMEVARVVCEWYYLDDEAKQQQPEHRGLWCKLGGGGRFPCISDENIKTSLESTMRDMLLTIMQQRAQESGIHLDLFTSEF